MGVSAYWNYQPQQWALAMVANISRDFVLLLCKWYTVSMKTTRSVTESQGIEAFGFSAL